MNINLTKLPQPQLSPDILPVDLTDETIQKRKNSVLSAMKREAVDVLVLYADREHGANFEYLTGFIPRFEEACLVLHATGKAYLLLGNENLKMQAYSRIEADRIHVPFFSLPNQPMNDDGPLAAYFRRAEIRGTSKVGIAGWKLFTSGQYDNRQLFDVPYFIIAALQEIMDDPAQLENRIDLLIAPEKGVRLIHSANEIAHYEFGASLAGNNMLETMNALEPGKTELEVASSLSRYGQPHNVTTICATGDRFTNATLYPRAKAIQLGEKFSLTTGYKGGLSSRAGYVAHSAEELEEKVQDYAEKVAKPYYTALVTWLEQIHIGMTGVDLYERIEQVLPREQYGWTLNPGHFTSDEEWASSPFYPDSPCVLKSGQLLQLDIIPGVPGYGGVGCEDGVALADAVLRKELQENYPQVWSRIERRQHYLREVLGIRISDEILPLNDMVGYYRPYVLDKEKAFQVSAD